MSLHAMQELLNHSQARGLDRAVGGAVAYYANHESGLAFPSNELLMRAWGFSERRIQLALRVLEDLGDLTRQPHLETHERRRIYVVGSGQLSILDVVSPVGAEVRAPTSVRAHDMPAPAEMPSRVKGTGNQNPTPPTPPSTPGGLSPTPSSSSPTVTALGVSGARRRRDRRARRAEMRAPSVAHEPCPQNGNGAGEQDRALAELWAALDVRLRQRVDEQAMDIWFGEAHPHRLDDGVLILALPPGQVRWARARFGQVITDESTCPVALVGCERLQEGGGT